MPRAKKSKQTTGSNKEDVWSPYVHGLSVTGLQTWLNDRFVAGARYLDNLQPIEKFEPKFVYGSYFQSCFEGYVNSGHQLRGAHAWLDRAVRKDKKLFGPQKHKDIGWWSSLALEHFYLFVEQYADDRDLPLSEVTESERNLRVEITLPSGRNLILNTYLDGEGGDSLMYEGKCRSKIEREAIAKEIRWDLQYNVYLLAKYSSSGKLPERVWYQTNLRPCGFGYRGPSKRKNESMTEFQQRILDDMRTTPEKYLYRFIGKPALSELERFCHGCLYPMLEAFLDWYDYRIDPEGKVNRWDWVTPYVLFNPLLQDMKEDYRNYRLTGYPAGLVKRKR